MIRVHVSKFLLSHLILIVIGVGFLLLQRCGNEHERNALEKALKLSQDSTRHYKGKVSGLEIAVASTQKYNKDQLKNLVTPELEEMRSVIKDMGVKLNRLESYSVSKTETKRSFALNKKDTLIPRFKDSLRVKDTFLVHATKMEFQDEWLIFQGLCVDGDDTCSATYWQLDQETHVKSWHRKWFLGSKIYDYRVQHANPHVFVSDITSIEEEPTRRFLFWKY